MSFQADGCPGAPKSLGEVLVGHGANEFYFGADPGARIGNEAKGRDSHFFALPANIFSVAAKTTGEGAVRKGSEQSDFPPRPGAWRPAQRSENGNASVPTAGLDREDGAAQTPGDILVPVRAQQFVFLPRPSPADHGAQRGNVQQLALATDRCAAAAQSPGEFRVVVSAQQPDFAGRPAARSGRQFDAPPFALDHDFLDGAAPSPGEDGIRLFAEQFGFGNRPHRAPASFNPAGSAFCQRRFQESKVSKGEATALLPPSGDGSLAMLCR